MEDDFGMEDNNPFAVPGLGTPEDRVRYTGQLTQLFDAQKAHAANQAAQYKAAEESIRQRRYGAPTTSEQLAALSQALLAPRRMRGLAGTLQNVLPALTQPAELQRRAEEQRAEDLMKLQQQQGMAASTAQMQALENQLKYGRPLLNQRAPQRDRVQLSSTDRPVNLETGRQITTPSSQALRTTLAQLRNPNESEEVKQQTRLLFLERYGAPVEQFLGE